MNQEKKERASPRQRVVKELRLLIGAAEISATLRDLSATGHDWNLEQIALPWTMIFVTDRALQDVILVWQKGRSAGVVFNGARKAMGIRKLI